MSESKLWKPGYNSDEKCNSYKYEHGNIEAIVWRTDKGWHKSLPYCWGYLDEDDDLYETAEEAAMAAYKIIKDTRDEFDEAVKELEGDME